jgi:hypothetical protein
VRGTGGTAPVSSLMDGSERLDARSDSLNPSNSVAGIRLNEGWMMLVAGLGTVGKRTSALLGMASRFSGLSATVCLYRLYPPTER